MPACILVSPVEASPQNGAVPTADRLHVVDINDPHISVLDLGVTRGDGIFEVLGAFDGRPHGVEPHLRRLATSAAMLDLPALDLEAIEAAIYKSIELSEPVPEGLIKVVVTRGIEGDGIATCWVIAMAGGGFQSERTEGISVAVLDRGYPHDIATRAPWLLAGAKTLSYAINKAVLREAARRGADDVLFVSSDGYVLEGPSSTLVAKFGNRIWTPSTALGILPGTTQDSVFRYFDSHGFATAQGIFRLEQLLKADALWLTSSVRLLAPIRQLDDDAIPVDHDLTDDINAFLKAREK